jgi:ATP-dependent Lhr-like helicase
VTPVEYTVECAGERIGVLQSDTVPLPNEAILLAGRRWRVEATYHDKRQVIVVPAQGKTPPGFIGTGGQINPKVMQKMREILAGGETFSYLSPKAAELLGAARTVFARIGLAVSDILSSGTETVWFPWAGTRAHEALSVLAVADRREIKKI